MGIPPVYRSSKENNILSFNVIDTITGVGYIRYYLAAHITPSLTTKKSFSISNELLNWSNEVTNAEPFEETEFASAEFQHPKEIEGTAMFEFVSAYRVTSGNLGSYSMKVEILKRDTDNIDTTIVEETNLLTRGATPGSTVWEVIGAYGKELEITKTRIKKGERIVVKINHYASVAAGQQLLVINPISDFDQNTDNLTVGTDADFTHLTIDIPFKIDI